MWLLPCTPSKSTKQGCNMHLKNCATSLSGNWQSNDVLGNKTAGEASFVACSNPNHTPHAGAWHDLQSRHNKADLGKTRNVHEGMQGFEEQVGAWSDELHALHSTDSSEWLKQVQLHFPKVSPNCTAGEAGKLNRKVAKRQLEKLEKEGATVANQLCKRQSI